MMIWVWT